MSRLGHATSGSCPRTERIASLNGWSGGLIQDKDRSCLGSRDVIDAYSESR